MTRPVYPESDFSEKKYKEYLEVMKDQNNPERRHTDVLLVSSFLDNQTDVLSSELIDTTLSLFADIANPESADPLSVHFSGVLQYNMSKKLADTRYEDFFAFIRNISKSVNNAKLIRALQMLRTTVEEQYERDEITVLIQLLKTNQEQEFEEEYHQLNLRRIKEGEKTDGFLYELRVFCYYQQSVMDDKGRTHYVLRHTQVNHAKITEYIEPILQAILDHTGDNRKNLEAVLWWEMPIPALQKLREVCDTNPALVMRVAAATASLRSAGSSDPVTYAATQTLNYAPNWVAFEEREVRRKQGKDNTLYDLQQLCHCVVM